MSKTNQSPETEINLDVVATKILASSDFPIGNEASDSLIGALFEGKYRIESKIGEGGMAAIYRANHVFMERQVAIKFLHDNLLKDAKAIEYFKREARAAGRIQHPNATSVLDFGMSDGLFYLVMEYLEGRTLRERLHAEGRLSWQETVRIISQVCEGVDAAHKCNVIHRDLKPDNIFLQIKDGVEHVKVLDFGIAKISNNSPSGYASFCPPTETCMGTPYYMSPEQCQGLQLSPCSDIYSLGVIAYEMLAGKPPFGGRSMILIALKHVKDQPPSLREIRPDLPPSIEEAIMRAVSKDPKNRQQSALQFAEQLLQAMNGMKVLPLREKERDRMRVKERDRTDPESAPTIHCKEIYEKTLSLAASQPFLSELPNETGNLSRTPLLSLLRRFCRKRLTGLLTFVNDGGVKTISFDHGAIVFAYSAIVGDRLGEMLIRRGRITVDEFDQATELMKSHGLRFGSALIKLGFIAVEELKPLIIKQVSNIIFSLFNWTAGKYEIRRVAPPQDRIEISLSTAEIIFEGLRLMENVDPLKRWLCNSAKVAPAKDQTFLLKAISFNPSEALMVSRIDKAMSVEEIFSMSRLSEVETLKTLCGLLVTGILEWVEEEGRLECQATTKLLGGMQPLPPDFDFQAAAVFCYEAENMLRCIENTSHYGVLGVERKATYEEIREAFVQKVEKFSPGRHAQLADCNPSLRAELEEILARVNYAYRVLSDPAARKEYDRIFRTSGQRRIPK